MKTEDQARFPAVDCVLKNGAKLTLRPLSPDDGPALGDFYATVPAEDMYFYFPHPLTREKAMENAAAALSPLEVVLVMETPDKTIAGYAWFRWQREDATASTFGICIRRDCQGLGAGSAITNRLLEIARVIGPPVMSLTVQKANKRAFALYRQMGFHVVRDQHRGSDGVPEYYMELNVR